MTNEKGLTARQQEVFDLLEKGKTTDEIAKKLKTTRNNVYGHMKRMRANGVDLPGREVGSTPAPKTPRKANGNNRSMNGVVREIDKLTAEAVQTAESRQTEITKRLKQIDAEHAKLDDEAAGLKAENAEIETRRGALAKVAV